MSDNPMERSGLVWERVDRNARNWSHRFTRTDPIDGSELSRCDRLSRQLIPVHHDTTIAVTFEQKNQIMLHRHRVAQKESR